MSNDINGLGNISTLVSSQSQTQAPGTAANRPNESGGQATRAPDSVSLTQSARQLQELEAQARSMPAVDPQRVDAVRDAIDTGTLQVNPDRIAQKLMQFEAYLPTAGN